VNALEKEIIEKFRQLTPENRLHVLSTLQEEVASQQISLAAWLAEADQVRLTLRPNASGHCVGDDLCVVPSGEK